jgi:hypothetical protein
MRVAAAFGFEANTPRSGPRSAGFSDEVPVGRKSENALGAGLYRSEEQ